MTTHVRWLIAKGNVFSPSAVAVAKLVERLRKEGWIGDEGAYAVVTVENTFGDDEERKRAATREPLPASPTKEWLEAPSREEIRMVWPAGGAGPRTPHYPLSLEPAGAVDYALEIHRAEEFVCPVGRLPATCKCGEDLSFGWDEDEVVPAFADATGIFAECDACSRTFDPSTEKATIKNPFDGTKEKVPGGSAYRFALVVRTREPFVADPKLAFAPALVALVENEFGRAFYEVAATS